MSSSTVLTRELILEVLTGKKWTKKIMPKLPDKVPDKMYTVESGIIHVLTLHISKGVLSIHLKQV